MATQLDASIGLGVESTYGTAVVVDRFYEFTDESMKWKPTFLQGQGLRVGTRLARNDRRKLGKQEAGGEIGLEAVSKGLGRIFAAVFGATTNTMIGAGPGYQQVHTLATSGPMQSFTIQKGTPRIGGSGVDALTFSGAVCSAMTLSCAVGDIVKIKSTWSARDVSSAPAYAVPSYPTSPELFTFVDGAITLGGTVTMPTSTALASGGTVVAYINDFEMSVDNKVDDGGFTLGAGGKKYRAPVLGLAEVKGKLTAEYVDTTLRDAYLNQTPLSAVLTFQSSVAIATGVYPTLQIVLPLIKLEGDVPSANGGKPIMLSIDYSVLDPAVSGQAPVYLVYRTADMAA